jgi:hypothetical protein
MSTKASTGGSKHLIAFSKAGNGGTDGFNVSGELHSWYTPGSDEASEHSSQKWLALSKGDVRRRKHRRMNVYQDFMLFRNGFGYLL